MLPLLKRLLSRHTREDERLRLHVALNNITQGVCFFDAAHRLIICNQRYIDLYRLPHERIHPGISLREVVDLRFAAGTCPAMSKEQYIRWRDQIAIADTISETTVELQDGRIIAIRHQPMTGGGWVATHDDITALKRSEESFRLLFDSNPMPMWLVDRETLRFLAVNDATLAHYGYTREQFLQMSALDLRFPEDRERSREFLLAGEMSQGLRQWRHRKANGEAILVSIFARNLDYSGHAARLCTAVDVTARKAAEETIHQQKRQLNSAIENMPQGLCMFDAEGRLVLFNDRYIEMYGLSRDVVKPGCALLDLMRHRREVGFFTDDPEAYARGVLENVGEGRTSAIEVELSDGRAIEVINRPMLDGGWVATHEDVTARKEAERRIAKETQEHRRLFEMSQDVILVTDRKGQVLRVSPIVKEILGYHPEEIVGRSAGDLVHPDDLDETRGAMRRARQGRHTRNCETRYRHKNGQLVTLAWSGAWSEPEQMHFFTCRDVSERKVVDAKLRHLAHYDQLTGLPNRASFLTDLSGQFATRSPTSLAMIDLDGFKDVNDTLGHSIGDALLESVARRLQDTANGGRIYRLGGDEFVLLLPGCADPTVIGGNVERIVKRLGEGFMVKGHTLYIGASAGIAIGPNDGSNVEELISNADLALYDAKGTGGRTYRLFQPTMRAQAQARRELDTQLRRACADQEFVLYYQPQLRMSDGAVVGAEALLRWRHPERGILSPGAFIGALADSPVALEAGRWIMQSACDSAAQWHAEGSPIRIGVNLFPIQFHAPTLLEDIEGALEKSGLPAELLEIEITENIALAHDERVLAPLRRLRARGVQLAFDDFGTGYASLSFLTRFPLTRLKIDQSFVSKIGEHFTGQDTAIVRSIIVMAHNLGLDVIAEGIETETQSAFLRGEGCDEGQGYLFARPMPAGEFREFLRAHRQGARIPTRLQRQG
jgi:diguanylate cyclase (GGDEF)-like protein/PAS domain S-box-containing protein